jgi:dUTP pyrophosphatase
MGDPTTPFAQPEIVCIFLESSFGEIPKYATEQSSGLDLSYSGPIPLVIPPGERRLVPTGIRLAIPGGLEGQIRPRSGLALKFGITVLNTPGTIDSDYRGEIGVILQNHSSEEFHINSGLKIAQIVFSKVEHVKMNQVQRLEDLGATKRGDGGYGSTGL